MAPRSFHFLKGDSLTEVRLSAPAKVNLFLGVGAIRSDGFHDVETILHPLELADEVVITPSKRLHVHCEPDVGVPETENIAFRAASTLAAASERQADVSISVIKRIPHKAGLGGGSSDAAAVLLGLSRLWGLDPLGETVQSVARSLGADVAFFLQPGPCRMTGRGDVLAERLPPVEAPIILVRPWADVPTSAAYRAFDDSPVPAGDASAVAEAMKRGDIRELGESIANNMEAASCSVAPAVCEALAWVRSRPYSIGAAVAGSGSAVFALTFDEESAQAAVREAAERGWWAESTRLSPTGTRVMEAGGGE